MNANHLHVGRAVARSDNPGGSLYWVGRICPGLVEIRLTDPSEIMSVDCVDMYK